MGRKRPGSRGRSRRINRGRSRRRLSPGPPPGGPPPPPPPGGPPPPPPPGGPRGRTRKKSRKKGKTKGRKRTANAFMKTLNAARKKGLSSFKYAGKVYKRSKNNPNIYKR